MKIKRIRISEYGPLRNFSLETGDFDIVFGLNEAGKTALVEVLAYVLFRKTAANLRYDKPTDVVIEVDEDGQTYSLPAKRLNVKLPVGDVANLMYVQASESMVFDDRGTRFWDGLKSMLSKVGSGVPFTKLDNQIFDAVHLQTQKGEWKRDKQVIIENETQRKKAMSDYLGKIGEIGKKEVDLVNLVDVHKFLKEKMELIDQYKNFHDYQELRRLYDAYHETLIGCQEYERYKYEYLTAWQKLDIEKKAKSDEGMKVEKIERERGELEKKYNELEELERRIETEGLRSAVGYMREEVSSPSLIFALIVTLMAVTAAVLSLFARLPMLPSIIFLVGSVFMLYSFIRRRNLVRKKQTEKEDWLNKARKVFPDIESLGDLQVRIEKIQEEKIRKKTAIDEKAITMEHLTSERSAETVDAEVADLRSKTGLAELHDLDKKLSEKRHLETELHKLGASLGQRLQESDPRKWERMIKERQSEKPGGEVDLEAESGLRRQQAEVQQMIDQLTKEIRLFRDIEQARVGIADDREAFQEYEALEKRLRGYELEKEAALKAREILRSMSSELDEFIGGVLQGENSLSEFIRAVTGRYEKVFVDNETFIVEDRAGKKYVLDNLSSGTKDQLLFCFRIAVLRRVYPKGAFMILDDAFIFADWQRRERLVRLVRDFVGQGNQVLYMTSDDHTRDLFKEHGAKVTSIT
jgi:energy-coupling factor transporter ATP-binding protein EcfA2